MEAGRFQGRSEAYAAGRQGYSAQALDVIRSLCPPESCPVALEAGAGTGIFTRALLDAGYRVLAVEPDAGMRAKMEEALKGERNVRILAASAERTTLKENAADFAVAASAFHWFDADAFRRECLRVLRGERQVFLLINARPMDDPFTREQDAICRSLLPGYESLDHGARDTERGAAGFFRPGYKRYDFPFDLTYEKEAFLQRSLSSSYGPRKGEAAYEPYVRELGRLIDRYEKGGRLTVRNETRLWAGQPAL